MAAMEEKLEHGLALLGRVRLNVSVSKKQRFGKQIDEWLLKEWMRSTVRKSLKIELGDKDIVKCSSEELITNWQVYLWKFQEMDKSLVPALDGTEVIIGEVKVKVSAYVDETDSFETMRCSWEAVYGLDISDHHRFSKYPDTLVIKGLPSRWFAEPTVSTEASVLVTHTVFSKFGKIRNLEIMSNGDARGISQALECQIWIQFDRFSGFINAMQALCGRSMQKSGSAYKANYIVDWDRSSFFNPSNIRKRRFEKEQAQKLANDAKMVQARKEAEEKRKAEEAEARRAEKARIAEEARRAEDERLRREKESLEQALREEEERRRKEQEEERIRQQQALEEQQRALEEQQRLLEERQKQEEVEERNRQIREATRKLLEDQEKRKQEALKKQQEDSKRKRRALQEEEEAKKKRKRVAVATMPNDETEYAGDVHDRWQLYVSEDEPYALEQESNRERYRWQLEGEPCRDRWQLYLSEDEPWPSDEQQGVNVVSSRCASVRSVIVANTQ